MNSPNQNIKPLTLKRNIKGNLELGGCDLTELAEQYSTPLYVIDEFTLRESLKSYKQAFSNYENINFLYASKANINLAIAKIVSDEGFGFDAVSGGEIYTIYKSGTDMRKVLFNGNNKSQEELSLALELNIGRFSVDNFYELETLNTLAEQKNKKVDILLRITPGIECHTHNYIKTGQLDSKFGFDMSQIDKAINLIKKYQNICLKGFHAHVGSQIFELKTFKDEIQILIQEILRVKKEHNLILEELNIGGGIGVKYTEEENPFSIYEAGDLITSEIKKAVKENNLQNLKLYLEPGRSIISNSGITLYTIGSSKTVDFNKRKYIAIDGGMADNPRPSLYGAKYTAEIANHKNSHKKEKVTVAGKFCESGDILIEETELKNPQPNDILCIYNTGAYNFSMSSNYNRFKKPKMVLVNNCQSDIIVKETSYEDLISYDVIPERLDKTK